MANPIQGKSDPETIARSMFIAVITGVATVIVFVVATVLIPS
jgi:hypothetical protein